MARWVACGKASDLRETMRVEVDGEEIALFRLDDGIFALDDICSHEYSRLSEGEIWDDEVYCPKHGSRFEIKTGKVRSLPAFKPVGSYPVKVDDDTIYIDLDGK